MPKRGRKQATTKNRHIICTCCNRLLHRTVVWWHQNRQRAHRALATATAATPRSLPRTNRRCSPSIASTISFSTVSDLDKEDLACDGILILQPNPNIDDKFPWLNHPPGPDDNADSSLEDTWEAGGQEGVDGARVEDNVQGGDSDAEDRGSDGEDPDLAGEDSEDWEPPSGEEDGDPEGSDDTSFRSCSDEEDRADDFDEDLMPSWMDHELWQGAYWELEIARSRKYFFCTASMQG